MTVFHKKSRMISFRLSADEYEAALRSCQACGARSVSALARSATLRMFPAINGMSFQNAHSSGGPMVDGGLTHVPHGGNGVDGSGSNGGELRVVVRPDDFLELQEQLFRLREEVERITQLLPAANTAPVGVS